MRKTAQAYFSMNQHTEDFDEIGQSHWQSEDDVDTVGDNSIDLVKAEMGEIWVEGDKFLWKNWDWDDTPIVLDFVLDFLLDLELDF